ncbi:MAG: MBL fold metallo-hydrolase [Opitutaceae bacterium]|nr:MBL fold metallo-hydrolase [Opitutaceae bacterium]
MQRPLGFCGRAVQGGVNLPAMSDFRFIPASDVPEALRARRVDGGFRNPVRHEDRTWWDVLRWKATTRGAAWPAREDTPPQDASAAPERGVTVTWVGHATFLVRTLGHTLLIDPVWSDRAGPFGVLGPRRIRSAALRFETLPHIDAVLLSHDHYDHCDLRTLRRLAREHPAARLLTPLGHEDLARRAGFSAARHTVHDWWDRSETAGLRITATPARHWGNRLSGRRNQRLWGGWYIEAADGARVFFVGDTAWDATMFAGIRDRLGAPDLALIPIGAYAPRWFMREQHCDPREAVAIARALGARRAMGAHWGTFRLTDEPMDEPPSLLAQARREAGMAEDWFTAPPPGARVRVGAE